MNGENASLATHTMLHDPLADLISLTKSMVLPSCGGEKLALAAAHLQQPQHFQEPKRPHQPQHLQQPLKR